MFCFQVMLLWLSWFSGSDQCTAPILDSRRVIRYEAVGLFESQMTEIALTLLLFIMVTAVKGAVLKIVQSLIVQSRLRKLHAASMAKNPLDFDAAASLLSLFKLPLPNPLLFFLTEQNIYIGLVRVITSVSHSNLYKILLNWNTMELMHKMVLILANSLNLRTQERQPKSQFSPVLTVFSKNLKKTYLHKSFLAPWDSPLSKLPYTYV